MTAETIEHVVDRAGWEPGPWDDEPDKVQFVTEAGLPGLIVRNPLGSLCGYAAVNPDHPLYGKDYDTPDVEVHGGLTYADACGGAICHTPAPGEPDNVWWFGFDCAHLEDLWPGQITRRGTYKTMGYVRAEVESLARQLKEATYGTTHGN